jgi:hypothetical protein
MIAEARIQAIARFLVGFGTEQDDVWRDYNLDFAGKITYGTDGQPTAFNPVGNSGYSLGSLQWDFGQGQDLAGPFVEAFEAWIKANSKATPLANDPEFVTRGLALTGNILRQKTSLGLSRQDVKALSEFVRSDEGSDWVNTNIDQNLIGSDTQLNIVVLGKTHGLSLVGVARKVEVTKAFKSYDAQNATAVTDLILAIGMKTYNQSPSAFTRKLIPLLSGSPSVSELSNWYKGFSGGLKSGVGAATSLSGFWADWCKANSTPLRDQTQSEMLSSCLLNPCLISKTDGEYVVAKQVFENPPQFAAFSSAIERGKDYINLKLFDSKTGAIQTNPLTTRLRPGLLVSKNSAYAWDAVGNAFRLDKDKWTPLPFTQINIKKL